MSKKLIILDRDGVINHDSDAYIKSPQEWIPIKGSLEAISRLNKAGYLIAIATNQSGIGRGYYDLVSLKAMHQKMQNLLTPLGGKIDQIAFCPHLPDANCECRKPKAGMLTHIIKKLNIKPENTVMIGDTISDFQAATTAKIAFTLVKTGKGERTLRQAKLPKHLPVYTDLVTYVNQLLN